MLNKDKNKLNSDITMIEASIRETEATLISIQDYTPELLDALKEKENSNRVLADRMSVLEEMSETLVQLKEIREIPHVETIDDSKLRDIDSLYSVVNEYLSMVDIPEVSIVDVSKLSIINTLAGLVKEISELDSSLPTVTEVNVDRLSDILELSKLLNEVTEVVSYSSSLVEKNEEISSTLKQLVSKAHEEGVYFTVCKNCGAWLQVGTKCSD